MDKYKKYNFSIENGGDFQFEKCDNIKNFQGSRNN